MGKARALINKLKRRRKNSNPNRGFRRQDKIDRKDEVLADSPGVYKYIRGIRRRQDSNFGQQIQPSAEYKPGVERLANANLAPQSIPNCIEATLGSAAEVAAIGVQAGDIVQVLTGVLKGRELKVTGVAAAVVTLEDDPDLASTENNAKLKIQISGTKTSHS